MMRIGDVIRQEVTATVAGEYDVIVCGAGTAGCAAALAAARGGAKTLLLEASPFLGGRMTEGMAMPYKKVIEQAEKPPVKQA